MRQLTSTDYEQNYYAQHCAAGLDYLGHGEWQESYGRWLVESLGWAGQHVLDVGCACGSIAAGLAKAGARVHGIDLSNHMIALGKRKWPHLPLYVCDSCNMLFGDASFAGIHSAQVAEHFRPHLVPHILSEWRRVLKPGGTIFVALDTEELFARQGRVGEKLAEEDATHVCVRPREWWRAHFAAAGLVLQAERDGEETRRGAGGERGRRLVEHAESFLRRYDWDWFLCSGEI